MIECGAPELKDLITKAKQELERYQDNHERTILGYNLNLNHSLKTIADIRKLEDGWNGYGAKKIPADICDITEEIVTHLSVQPAIFPTARRTIHMEYNFENSNYLEFEIFEDDVRATFVPDHDYYNKAKFERFNVNDYEGLNAMVKAAQENNVNSSYEKASDLDE